MKITAAGQEIEARSILEETWGPDKRRAIRIVLPAGISKTKQDALKSGNIVIDDGYARYEGYTEPVEHAIVLVRVVDIGAMETEMQRMRAELDALKGVSEHE